MSKYSFRSQDTLISHLAPVYGAVTISRNRGVWTAHATYWTGLGYTIPSALVHLLSLAVANTGGGYGQDAIGQIDGLGFDSALAESLYFMIGPVDIVRLPFVWEVDTAAHRVTETTLNEALRASIEAMWEQIQAHS